MKTRFYGTRTLYHLTTEDAAKSIMASMEFRNSRAAPPYRPMFGEFIYFAGCPEDCEGKSRTAASLSDGALLKAEVSLGTALLCGDRCPSPSVQAFLKITSWADLTADKLHKAQCESVCGTQPIVSRDEYAVPSSRQVRNIRVSGYRDPQNAGSPDQPWWLWPRWVHSLAAVTGVDQEDLELAAQIHASLHKGVAPVSGTQDSSVNGVRVNSAGRPIHSNGRFMSYAEATSRGWNGPAGGSQPDRRRPASGNSTAHAGHRSHSNADRASSASQRPNAWNEFQHRHGGQGHTRQEMHREYAEHQNRCGDSQRCRPAARSPAAPRPNACESQHINGGQGRTRQEMCKDHAAQQISRSHSQGSIVAVSSPAAPIVNAWNLFQHLHGGQGLTRQEMRCEYAAFQAGMPNLGAMAKSTGGFGAISSSGAGGGGGGLGWNAFQASVGGQGYSKSEISAMYHAQK